MMFLYSLLILTIICLHFHEYIMAKIGKIILVMGYACNMEHLKDNG